MENIAYEAFVQVGRNAAAVLGTRSGHQILRRSSQSSLFRSKVSHQVVYNCMNSVTAKIMAGEVTQW